MNQPFPYLHPCLHPQKKYGLYKSPRFAMVFLANKAVILAGYGYQMLALNCTNVGIKLYQYWHQNVPILVPNFTNVGTKLYQCWHHQIVSVLASNCISICSKWKPPLNYFVQVNCTFCSCSCSCDYIDQCTGFYISTFSLFSSHFQVTFQTSQTCRKQ